MRYLELNPKLRIRVAPPSKSAVPAVPISPECGCGPGGPHDSRPGGRRYLFTDKFYARFLFAAFFADFYVEALDFLVEGGEGDMELLGGVGLVAVAAL